MADAVSLEHAVSYQVLQSFTRCVRPRNPTCASHQGVTHAGRSATTYAAARTPRVWAHDFAAQPSRGAALTAGRAAAHAPWAQGLAYEFCAAGLSPPAGYRPADPRPACWSSAVAGGSSAWPARKRSRRRSPGWMRTPPCFPISSCTPRAMGSISPPARAPLRNSRPKTSRPSSSSWGRISVSLIGSRALAAYDDVDGPSAANNRPWSRKYTARLLRRSDASASAHGYVGTRSVRLEGAGSVG